MIALVNAANEQAFLQFCNREPAFGPMVYTQYRCYKGLRMALFWVAIQEDGRVMGAISSVGGTFYISCFALVREEIALFLHFMSMQDVQGEAELISLLEDISPAPFAYSPGMIYAGGALPEKSTLVCDHYSDYRLLFALLCHSYPNFEETVSYDAWLSHITLAERRGMAASFAICQEGVPICCGMLSHRSEVHCRIGSIATLPAYRGRGYATAMVKHLTATALERGLTPTLHCATAALQSFYTPLNYRPLTLWCGGLATERSFADISATSG